MSLPYDYEIQNIVASSYTPANPKVRGSYEYALFCRYLWQKAISVFKWILPETWETEFVTRVLYGLGFLVVVDTPKFGIIPQPGTVGGYNVFYEPLYAMIANPLLPDLTGKQMIIDRDCSIIKLTPDYLGIGDLVGYYAEKMSLASQALSVNFSNSKLSYVFGAKDKTQATTFKKMFDQILNGEPAVVIDKSLYNDDGTPNWQIFNQNLQQTYIVSDLISDLRKIEAEFDTKIGIPNANTDKRERLISDEVNANNAETSSISDLWLDTIREGIKKTMKLYPDLPEIKVERRYKDAEQRDNVDLRPMGA